MRFGNSSSSSGSLFSGGLFGGPHPQLLAMFQLYGYTDGFSTFSV